MLCFLNNLYVSLNVNMKKTQFKLILNSNSYRIYTDNGIEYCRFKKKYYPLDEMENVINSYKTGGAKMFLIIPVLFIVIITKIIKDKSVIDKSGKSKTFSEALKKYEQVDMVERFEILYATIYIILIYSPKINRNILKLKSNDFDASLSSNNSTLYNNLSEALSIGRTIYYNNKSLNNPEPGTRMNNTFGGESDVKAVIAKIKKIMPKIIKEVNSTITIQSSYIPKELQIYDAECINVTTLDQIVQIYINYIGPLIDRLQILDTFRNGTYINNDIRKILERLADTIDIYNSIIPPVTKTDATLYRNYIETNDHKYKDIITASCVEGLTKLNNSLQTNTNADILLSISYQGDIVQSINKLKDAFKKLVTEVIKYDSCDVALTDQKKNSFSLPVVKELFRAMKKIGVEELNDTLELETASLLKYRYMRKMANVFFINFDEIFLDIIYLITAEIPLPQKLKATTDAEISQTEVIEPPLLQKLKATTDAEISQTEVIEPPLPQIIEATTDADISQTEVIEPPLPQKLKATTDAEISQTEVIEPPLLQKLKATTDAEISQTEVIEPPLPQKLKATTDAEISQTEVIEPPLPQKLKATTDAEISQTEVIEPPLPQKLKATGPIVDISQTEVIEPPLPQKLKATGPIVDISQTEVIEPPLPQKLKATGPIVDINQKVEDITPDKQTTIELDRRIELATHIKQFLETNNIPIIYTYYFYVKYITYTTYTDDTATILIQIKNKHEKHKDTYTDICDAVNKLMIYLTGTATKIQIEYYTDKKLCEEYTIYFNTLVFNTEMIRAIMRKINDPADSSGQLTKKYMRALKGLKGFVKLCPNVFKHVDQATLDDLYELLGIQGGDNNYKTAIDNIFNYTESSDESDILYDSDISEESIISIRSDYSEDLITPLLTPQT